MASIITALCIIGFIALIVALLKFVHARDQKSSKPDTITGSPD